MRADMSFPQDQMVLFKAVDKDGNVTSRYGIFDLGAGTIDSVTLEQTLKKGEISFTYFYDTTNAKSVIVSYEGEAEPRPGVVYPILVETKGPDPVEPLWQRAMMTGTMMTTRRARTKMMMKTGKKSMMRTKGKNSL